MYNIQFVNKILENKIFNKYRNRFLKKNCLVYLVKNIPNFLGTHFYSITDNPNIIYLKNEVLDHILETRDLNLCKSLLDSPYFNYDFYRTLNDQLKIKLQTELPALFWEQLLACPIIGLNDVEKIITEYPKVNLNFLMLNPNLTEPFLEKLRGRVDFDFHRSDLCRCENIGIEWLIKNLKKINMRYVSARKNITEDILRKWSDLDWYWDILSGNKNISISFICKNINNGWDWDAISWRASESDVENNPKAPWVKRNFLYNFNMSLKFIFEKNPLESQPICIYNENYVVPDLQFLKGYSDRICFLTNSVYAKEKVIKEALDFSWNWQGIWEYNKNISIDFIRENIEKVDFFSLSRNPNITLDFICEHIDKNWNWDGLASNEFLFNSVVLKKKLIKDIKKRRNSIIAVNLFSCNIERMVLSYVGYV